VNKKLNRLQIFPRNKGNIINNGKGRWSMNRNYRYGLAVFTLRQVGELANQKGYWENFCRIMIGLKNHKEDGKKLRVKAGSILKEFSETSYQRVVLRG